MLEDLKKVIDTVNNPIPDPIKKVIEQVQTGDTAPIAILVGISLGAFAGMYYFGKKKK